jgi:spore maturation protein CgeB
MRIIYFTHSVTSCWNNGNAHFLRGVARALCHGGHEVCLWEPVVSWSGENLRREGPEAEAAFGTQFADLLPAVRRLPAPDEESLIAAVAGADLVIAHEWNEPALVAGLGRLRQHGGRFLLLFHDTHHRMVSDPGAMARFDLSAYDGVLAFGESLSAAYRRQGWGSRVFTWHEAADTTLFRPPSIPSRRDGAVWIGNWGDGERSEELHDYLLAPLAATDIPLTIHGVRYPEEAMAALRRSGAEHRGWLANTAVPEVFARHVFTLHVPRRFYVTHLPGIPTIRVFEALACGMPLVCAPWEDSERLFTPGRDYLQARDPAEMARLARALYHDAELRTALAAHGLATIHARHSCAHRAAELLAIAAKLRGAPEEAA